MTPAEAANRVSHEIGITIPTSDPMAQEVKTLMAASWEMFAAFLEGRIE